MIGTRAGTAALACTAAYGGLKLYWALGGDVGLRQVPLPPDAVQAALAREPAAVLGHWVSVGLAVLGIGAALFLARQPGKGPARWLLAGPIALLAALMIARGIVQPIGDVQRLASPTAATTARWDLLLWSPFFLLWGVCWAFAVSPWFRSARSPRRTGAASGRTPRSPAMTPAATPPSAPDSR